MKEISVDEQEFLDEDDYVNCDKNLKGGGILSFEEIANLVQEEQKIFIRSHKSKAKDVGTVMLGEKIQVVVPEIVCHEQSISGQQEDKHENIFLKTSFEEDSNSDLESPIYASTLKKKRKRNENEKEEIYFFPSDKSKVEITEDFVASFRKTNKARRSFENTSETETTESDS
jgi:hypothetical protein